MLLINFLSFFGHYTSENIVKTAYNYFLVHFCFLINFASSALNALTPSFQLTSLLSSLSSDSLLVGFWTSLYIFSNSVTSSHLYLSSKQLKNNYHDYNTLLKNRRPTVLGTLTLSKYLLTKWNPERLKVVFQNGQRSKYDSVNVLFVARVYIHS